MFGPVVSFGLGGVATELLDDWSHGIPPLTDSDLRGLVRSVRAAPLLFGHRGSDPVDTAQLEDLLARVAQLADDLPEVAVLELNPVVVGSEGPSVLGADRAAGPATGAHRPGRASAARLTSAPAGRLPRATGETRRACRVRRSLVSVGESPVACRGLTRPGAGCDVRAVTCGDLASGPGARMDVMTDTTLAGLRAAIERAGYYPELVAEAVDAAVAGETVESFLVHQETTFDPTRCAGTSPCWCSPRPGSSSATPTTTRPTS